jgi:uracil-DNA glycosylase family 4
LADQCGACQGCPLAQGRQQVVFSRGNPQARLMLIGEAPGAQEDALGQPFVGRSGQLLDQLLAEAGLDSNRDAYICNGVKCRPPENRKPTARELAACRPWLEQQIVLVQPQVLVLVGATALQAVLAIKGPISQLRGQWLAFGGAIACRSSIPPICSATAQRSQAGPGTSPGRTWWPCGSACWSWRPRSPCPLPPVASCSVTGLGGPPAPPHDRHPGPPRCRHPGVTPEPASRGSGADWASDPRFDSVIHRRQTRSVRVGGIAIGSEHPVVVQSMINEDTLDIEGATAGIRRLHEAGCEIVRLTVPSLAHAKAVAEIRKRLEDSYQPVPLVADVHHNGMKIALEVAQHVDKVRINPGLFVFDKPDPNRSSFSEEELAQIADRIALTFEPLVSLLKGQDKALRIGVNHGSLAERMLFTFGDTPSGWWSRRWSSSASATASISTTSWCR